MDVVEVSLLILRLWLAVVIVSHGVKHARSLAGTARWFASKGFRHPALQARLSAAGEIAIGVGLAGGLLTSFAAAGLVATMVVAWWAIHRPAGFFVSARPDEGYEYVATLSVCALVVAVTGPGPFAADVMLGIADRFDGLIGAVIVAAGVAAAAAHLVVFWRAPADQEGADA